MAKQPVCLCGCELEKHSVGLGCRVCDCKEFYTTPVSEEIKVYGGSPSDEEAKAILVICDAMETLMSESQYRVMDYLRGRYDG